MIKDFLSALLLDKKNLSTVIIEGINPDFFPPENFIEKLFFELLINFFKKYGDVFDRSQFINLVSNLSFEERISLISLYEELINTTPKNFQFLIDSIKQEYINRKLQNAITSSASLLEKQNFDFAYKQLKRELLNIETVLAKEVKEGAINHSVDIRRQKYKEAKEGIIQPGLKIGFPTFDKLTNGLYPAELMVVVAGTSEGKSTFMLNVGHYIHSILGKNVLYVSLENPKVQLERRYDALDSGVSAYKIKTGNMSAEEEKKYFESLERQKNYKGVFYILDVPNNCTGTFISAKLQELKARYTFDLVIVDYLGLMKAESRTNSIWEAYSDIALSLRGIGRVYNVPVLTAAQVNRSGMKSKSTYSLDDIALSFLITNHADIVLSLKISEPEVLEISPVAEVTAVINKNRDGAKGRFRINAVFDIMRMAEV